MRVARRRFLELAVAVNLSLGLSTAGCEAFVLRQDVESARAVWSGYPDEQRTTAYAEALHDAFVRHAYADDAVTFTQHADEALAGLAGAESKSGSQLPELLAYRGLLLLDLGRNHEAWSELQRSMAITPTLVAARGIVPVWGARSQPDKVADTCARTLRAVRRASTRFELLDLCVRNMHSVSEAAALAWAPPEAAAFYRDERARRQQAATWSSDQQGPEAFQLANQQALQAAAMASQLAAEMANQTAMAAAQQAAQMAAAPP